MELSKLTERERQVYDKVIEGLSTKEIARSLDLSPRTIEIHTYRVFDKLNVKGRVKLIIKSYENKIDDTCKKLEGVIKVNYNGHVGILLTKILNEIRTN